MTEPGPCEAVEATTRLSATAATIPPPQTVLAQYKIAADDVLGAAALLVGLAVTWFALSMSDRAAGGALVLGWFTVSSLIFISGVYTWTTTVWLECILVAVSVAMALAYIREPSRAQSPAF